ncbi:MAG: hypothetical protein KUG78_20985 [Kangiellaceae bacterium]|nr:hypothetical protein [Kangiellaceae bacterium]
MPFLAKELVEGLSDIGEQTLANSISDLKIIDRCRCDSQGCGTFYTMNKEIWSGKKLKQVIPEVKGLYAIDVFENNIACIEIMERSDVAEQLISSYP